MNLKDIFTEYAKQQRKLCAENAILFKDWKVELGGENIGSGYEYSVDKSSILNAPEPPLPEIPVIRWVKALGQEPPDGVCLPLKINGQYDFGFANHYTKRFICTRSLEPIPYRKVEWLFDPSRADLYMILPGVEKK